MSNDETSPLAAELAKLLQAIAEKHAGTETALVDETLQEAAGDALALLIRRVVRLLSQRYTERGVIITNGHRKLIRAAYVGGLKDTGREHGDGDDFGDEAFDAVYIEHGGDYPDHNLPPYVLQEVYRLGRRDGVVTLSALTKSMDTGFYE